MLRTLKSCKKICFVFSLVYFFFFLLILIIVLTLSFQDSLSLVPNGLNANPGFWCPFAPWCRRRVSRPPIC
ncbi:hypothetical protein XELAEV_18014422mg [Xenopus laevis]|uniref:Uncharacterized protein n=1 Tax=Xenopus laevis TaxID=8355 RepID=A0A974HV42_XENLA|nr:hypothetical protein XELAEV_18014422mg [Xenopus laevis]